MAAEQGKQTHVLDCEGRSIGRVAQEAVALVRRTRSVLYNPCEPEKGAPLVLVKNVSKVRVLFPFKKYQTHSGYAGGHRLTFIGDMLKRNPRFAFKRACWGQMPKNASCRRLLSLIRVI